MNSVLNRRNTNPEIDCAPSTIELSRRKKDQELLVSARIRNIQRTFERDLEMMNARHSCERANLQETQAIEKEKLIHQRDSWIAQLISNSQNTVSHMFNEAYSARFEERSNQLNTYKQKYKRQHKDQRVTEPIEGLLTEASIEQLVNFVDSIERQQGQKEFISHRKLDAQPEDYFSFLNEAETIQEVPFSSSLNGTNKENKSHLAQNSSFQRIKSSFSNNNFFSKANSGKKEDMSRISIQETINQPPMHTLDIFAGRKSTSVWQKIKETNSPLIGTQISKENKWTISNQLSNSIENSTFQSENRKWKSSSNYSRFKKTNSIANQEIKQGIDINQLKKLRQSMRTSNF